MGYRDNMLHIGGLDRQYIWHPFTQMKDWMAGSPLMIVEGRDCFLKDAQGRWYLDGVSSLWVNLHGHRRKEIDDAIRDQLGKIAHTTLLGLANIPSSLLAGKLISVTDHSFRDLSPRLSKVFYSDNGSTSVEVALKMAFQYWVHRGIRDKHAFLCLKNAYHGDTIGAVSVGGVELFHGLFKPLLFETYHAPSPYCYRCELGLRRSSCSLACLQALEGILSEHGRKIAAVIVEPLVQAAGGMIVWPEGYLGALRSLCDRYDTLLIADEVATGFGRTGKMFACEHEGIVPDILCLSKGLTNGYLPLAATLATDNLFDAFLGEFKDLKTFFHGHSYTGNPLACAAACASIDIFDRDRTLEKMRDTVPVLWQALQEMRDLPHVGDVRQKGLMAGIELVHDKPTKDPYPFEMKMGWMVAHEARRKGVIIRPLGNVIVIMPPICISSEHLSRMLTVIRESIVSATSS